MSNDKQADSKRTRVTLFDLAKGVVKMIPDAPGMIRNAPGLVFNSPTTKKTIGSVLQQQAASRPDAPLLRFEGKDRSYGEVNKAANRYAEVLRENGVRAGATVALLGKNHPETVINVFATVKIGAVAGMLNYNQRGKVLEHSLKLLEADVLIVDPELVDVIDSVDQSVVPKIRFTFDEMIAASVDRDARDRPETAELPASTQAFYIFTSGTTGLPKASVMTHFRWLRSCTGLAGLGVRMRPHDTMYCALPLYHNNALTVSLGSVLSSGGTLALGRKFSVSKFWDEIILNKATAFCYIGELCRYLVAQPAGENDRKHQVRLVVGNGMRPEIWPEFQKRFGVDRIVEFYGASELNLAFVNAFSVDQTAGFCPLPYKVVKYESDGTPQRDARGRLTAVEKGGVGLLIAKVDKRNPFDGYTDNKSTEAKLIRDAFADGDAWMNTGDLVRDQRWNHIAFVDRLGDTFRWKGENVATGEVEAVLSSFDAITESVVYGVEIEGTDGRAGMAAVTLVDGELDGAALAEHLTERLPSYAVPLFVRIVEDLATTSTFKNQKVDLRKQGFSEVGNDPLYVLADKKDGYVKFYDDYPRDVAAARAPR